jgi:isoleucyl-tRNA synthetase
MDYKDTLNLPRTAFPMKADLVAREPQRLALWQQSRLYERIQAARAGAPRFVLHDGPPFANGDVHIGTARNKVLKDILLRHQTLRGRQAPYIPGWDCHGLPIEFKVTQEMRKKGDTRADPVALRQACEAYARKYLDIQRRQFQRLGVLGDWDRPYLTLDKEYEAEELRLFADVVEKGFVYRGKKPVYWSIPCRTALAEAEVEYQDHVSQSIYVKFPIVGRPGTFLLIWTTTPWTLPANLAVAYNSTFSYSLGRVTVGDDRTEDYLVSAMLLNSVAEKCRWQNFSIVRSLDAGHLAEVEFQHPFCERTGKLYAGDAFVDNITGTGFVHIAPGHGLEDYGVGLEHGLPIYSPVNDDGCFTHTNDLPAAQQMPAELLGKSILEKHGKSEANEAVLHLLRQKQALLHQEDYSHSYPHCWRSKTPVIFRAMDQWFIEIDHVPDTRCQTSDAGVGRNPESGIGNPASGKTFRQLALEAIGHVSWVPDWGQNRIEAAVKSRPDWCISRQRAWGVPIPAFYDAQGHAILDARIVRAAADLCEQHGSNAWFEQSAAELWARLRPKDWTGPEATAKSNDTLDVWIDSGSSSRCVIARHPELRGTEKPFQCDMYLEGSDQHRGWFQSSLLLSLAANGAPPYRTVLTHGFIVDADREKISKSKQSQGGYDKPQTAERYIKDYGADVLRLWIASQDFRNDSIVSDERLKKVSETYRLLRNTLRYQLSNLFDFDPSEHTVPDDRLTSLDRWILGEFAKLEQDIAAAYDAHEFHVVYQRVSQFAAVELSAVYHDVVKDRLYTDPMDSPRRRSTQTALHRMVTGICQMLSPILVFTADEAWEYVPGHRGESVHASEWKPRGFALDAAEAAQWQKLFALREQVLPELEKARQAKAIGKALEARIELELPEGEANVIRGLVGELQELLNLSGLKLVAASSAPTPEAQAAPVVRVAQADGRKCERCWHWETDVGQHAAHPTLCGRCVEAVRSRVGV